MFDDRAILSMKLSRNEYYTVNIGSAVFSRVSATKGAAIDGPRGEATDGEEEKVRGTSGDDRVTVR